MGSSLRLPAPGRPLHPMRTPLLTPRADDSVHSSLRARGTGSLLDRVDDHRRTGQARPVRNVRGERGVDRAFASRSVLRGKKLMTIRRLVTLGLAFFAMTWGVDQTVMAAKEKPKPLQTITPAQRNAAAKRAAQKGLKPGVAGRSDKSAARPGRRTTVLAEPGQTAAVEPFPGIEG